MKKLLAISALAAVLFAVIPTQAMFNHAGKVFRTAVMNRSLTTRTPGSVFASIHQGRKPLTAVGALIGLGSTGYLVQQAQKAKAAPAERIRFNCGQDIAELTREALRENAMGYYAWMDMREKAFKYCQKSMPRQQIYAQNIAYAQQVAKEASEISSGDLSYRGFFAHARAQVYGRLAQHLEQELEQEQNQRDRVRELMPYWPV